MLDWRDSASPVHCTLSQALPPPHSASQALHSLALELALAAMRLRTVRSLRSADRSVTEMARRHVGLEGLRLPGALEHLVEPDVESRPIGTSCVEVDAPAEI